MSRNSQFHSPLVSQAIKIQPTSIRALFELYNIQNCRSRILFSKWYLSQITSCTYLDMTKIHFSTFKIIKNFMFCLALENEKSGHVTLISRESHYLVKMVIFKFRSFSIRSLYLVNLLKFPMWNHVTLNPWWHSSHAIKYALLVSRSS